MAGRIILLLFFLVFLSPFVNAQCQVTSGIDPNFPCDPAYRPVCGCDGKTYRNDCDAMYRNGIQYYTDGTCSGFEFDIYPTITEYNPVHFTLVVDQTHANFNPTTIMVFDTKGNIMYREVAPITFNNSSSFYVSQIDIPASDFPASVYIIIVYNTNGDYRFKKFIKNSQ